MSAPGGCLLLGGVCSWGGVSALGWVSALGGVCSWGVSGLGGVVSHHALRQTPPPPCRQTDACKNIAFANSLRTVKTEFPIELPGNLLQGLHLSDFTDDPEYETKVLNKKY